MSLDGAAGLRGWQWLFLLEGVAPLLLAAALPFWLPASPLTAPFLSPDEQQWLWREVNAEQPGIELVPAAPEAGSDGLEAGASGAGQHEVASLAAPAAAGPGAEATATQHTAGHAESEHAELLATHKRGGEGPSEAPVAGQLPSPGDGGGGDSGGLRAAARRGLSDPRVWVLGIVMLLVDVCMNAVRRGWPGWERCWRLQPGGRAQGQASWPAEPGTQSSAAGPTAGNSQRVMPGA